MKKKRAVILSAIALVLVAGIVTAVVLLQKNGIFDRVGPEEEEKEPSFVVWHQFAPNTPEAAYLENTLLDQFSKSHPNEIVSAAYYEGMEIRSQLLAAKRDGNLPDVVFVSPEWLPELVRLDILTSLEDTQEGFADVSATLLDGALDAGRREEHIYGLPFSVQTQMMLYNPALFERVSVQPPTSYSALGPAVEAVSGLGDNIYGLALNGINATSMAPFIWTNGGELTDPEQTQASGSLNSTSNVAVVELFSGLVANNAILDTSAGAEDPVKLFAEGNIGMIMADPAFVGRLRTQYPDFKFESLMVPAGQGGYRTVLSSTLVALPVSEDTGLAWEFTKTLVGEATQKEFAKYGTIPANKTALESSEAKASSFAEYIPALTAARALPNVTEWVDLNNEFTLTMTQIAEGYKPAQQAMDDLAKTWDALLP